MVFTENMLSVFEVDINNIIKYKQINIGGQLTRSTIAIMGIFC